jgi:hypothetical protein
MTHAEILADIAAQVVREHRLHGNQPTNVPVPAPLAVITEHWPNDAPVDPGWDYTLPEEYQA